MDGYLTWVAADLEQRFVLAASAEIGKDQHYRQLLMALMPHNLGIESITIYHRNRGIETIK